MTAADITLSGLDSSRPAARLAEALKLAAMTLLLACMAGRCFVGELPFRRPMMPPAAGQGQLQGGMSASADRSEIFRVTFAVAILAAAAIWLLASALSGALAFRCGRLAVLILLFALYSRLIALCACDRRAAMDGWIEQVSLLVAGLLAVQVFADRAGFRLLVIVLAALAGAMAVKSFWQLAVEIPDRIGDFEAHRPQRLAEFGWQVGSPQATLIESRLKDRSVTGFFPLANVFASLMIVLVAAAGGLAAEKLAEVKRGWQAWKAARKPGQIDPALVAAVLTGAMAAAAVAALVLTRSRGGIAAALVGAIAAVAASLLARRLARHWRKCAAVVAGLFLAGAAAVVAYGLAFDRLPTKTMTFRWYYWTASGEIIRDWPLLGLLGVGPGNFPAAYLVHRRAAAEEEIKMPHNVIVHAVVEYGLPTAALYLGVLGCFVVGATRPRRQQDPSGQSPVQPGRGLLLVMLPILVLAALAARVAFEGLTMPEAVLIEAVMPAAAFGLCLVVAAWCGRQPSAGAEGPSGVARIALAAAVGAVVLCDMVNTGLFVPGSAMVFWVAAGACVAQAGGPGRSWRLARWPVAVLAIVAVAALGWFFRPVWVRAMHAEEAAAELRRGNVGAAVASAVAAAQADPLDGRSAADAARVTAASCPQGPAGRAQCLSQAYDWSQEAIRRCPAESSFRRLAAGLAGELAVWAASKEDRYRAMRRQRDHLAIAVDLDPMDSLLRIQYASALLAGGLAGQSLEQLLAAEDIDAQLAPESVEKLNAAHRAEIGALKSRCRSAGGGGQAKPN